MAFGPSLVWRTIRAMDDPATQGNEAPGDARVVLMTHPEEGADAFAEGLVERRLVACVNLLPVTSVYRWEGSLQKDGERLLIAKTVAERLPELEAHLAAAHPYDVPELVALPAAHVAGGYLGWLVSETSERS